MPFNDMDLFAAGNFAPSWADFLVDARRKVVRTWFVQIFLIDSHVIAPFFLEERWWRKHLVQLKYIAGSANNQMQTVFGSRGVNMNNISRFTTVVTN